MVVSQLSIKVKKCFKIIILTFISYTVIAKGYCQQIPVGSRTLTALSLTIKIKNPSCAKSIGHDFSPIGDGSIYITASGGTPPYTFTLDLPYHFESIQNNGYFPGLIGATYNITVADSNGASIDSTITLTDAFPYANLNLSVLNLPSSCTSSDGSFALVGSGGTPPYTFSIDGGNTFTTTNTFSNLSQGSYACYMQDANGCLTGSADYSFFLQPQCAIYVGPNSLFSTACTKEGTYTIWILSNDASNTTPWLISYDGINYRMPNDGSYMDSVSNLAPGIYHVYAKDSLTQQVSESAFVVGKSCTIFITFVTVEASCHQSDGSLTVYSIVGLVTNNFSILHNELSIQIYQFLLHKMRLRNIYIPADSLQDSMALIMDYYVYRSVFESAHLYSTSQHLKGFVPKTGIVCPLHLLCTPAVKGCRYL